MNIDNRLDRIQNCLTHLAQHPMPLEFHNSLTTGEFLMELYTLIKEYLEMGDMTKNEILEEINKRIDGIKDEVLNLVSNDLYVNHLFDFLKNEIGHLVDEAIQASLQFISFGLTEDGHFCAYIPENLEGMHLATSFNEPDFGNLVLILANEKEIEEWSVNADAYL